MKKSELKEEIQRLNKQLRILVNKPESYEAESIRCIVKLDQAVEDMIWNMWIGTDTKTEGLIPMIGHPTIENLKEYGNSTGNYYPTKEMIERENELLSRSDKHKG